MDSFYALGLGYLLGSVPFGLILMRLLGAGDPRDIGSGNIGATNVLRSGRKGIAAATLLLDLGKGLLAVWLAWRWFPEVPGMAALGAVLGHCFPVWLKFKGGKGVATTMGVTLALAWPIGATYAGVWLAMLAVTRISSLAGMTAAVAAPVVAFALGLPELVPVLVAIAVLVLVLHRANIQRLLAGTEPKIGSKN
ncbi:glycerol-3-phosphate 1-O-acyltransferase PlsY [Novosphingobium sp.]|uniref:glycerol-3-phosphate 1-O-acyltransferase PlsY n=1 Tax=Novosphingobium sp. TaxID=1874826 RepID=UPI001EB5FBAE|nr:glycerol-3-phosphate 1-O-acyltransferase PlsY [Novosphingobium sp.]MBK6800903.1 glycerol-3-phosphate 1-O-acyltransferase PlsY [Novosphingobium sp.]MBK9011461.1 glycerol-3-phosphate 1-O-acyltransferase PlsY [Novosphingobium sp.]